MLHHKLLLLANPIVDGEIEESQQLLLLRHIQTGEDRDVVLSLRTKNIASSRGVYICPTITISSFVEHAPANSNNGEACWARAGVYLLCNERRLALGKQIAVGACQVGILSNCASIHARLLWRNVRAQLLLRLHI